MQRRFRITLTETVEVTETITILVEGRTTQKERELAEQAIEQKQFPVGPRRPYRFHKRKTRKRPKSI